MRHEAEGGRLILISGAVASGKTTLARRLAQLARTRGMRAASIDVDDVVMMVARDWGSVTKGKRRLACELTAVIAQGLFDREAKLVAIAGSTLSPYEWEETLSHLEESVPAPTYVLLRVTIDEATRRAQADATRNATWQHPETVARLHGAIDWQRVREPDIDIDTEQLTPDDAAEVIWRAAFAQT